MDVHGETWARLFDVTDSLKAKKECTGGPAFNRPTDFAWTFRPLGRYRDPPDFPGLERSEKPLTNQQGA